jgi:protein-tyrosine-phosphatase
MLGPVSGAHFNPVISFVDAAFGGLRWRHAIAYVPAGSEPADQLNPSIVAVLRERGLDPGREFPKPLTDEMALAAHVVVTMGCGDACPVYPGKRYLDWDLEDPAG